MPSCRSAIARTGPGGCERICLISRVDPIKRIDLLFDADGCGACAAQHCEFTVFGEGWDYDRLQAPAPRPTTR
jgi:hypothetical protein